MMLRMMEIEKDLIEIKKWNLIMLTVKDCFKP